MLEHFMHNDLLKQRLNETSARDQFINLVQFGHEQGLDWYFTGVPDLRCGRKENDSARASSVCFRIWIKNANELRIDSNSILKIQNPRMPLRPADFMLLKRRIKRFVEDNPSERGNGAYLPDQYHTVGSVSDESFFLAATIKRVIRTMLGTVANSNGQMVTRIMKNKETTLNENEAEAFLKQLFDDQDGFCAITGIKLQLDGNITNPELAWSLDRIDSNGQYDRNNLQIVCNFVNRWKSNSPDEKFRELIDMVKSAS